ncbi:MAG: CPBP family intramembrane metalloprotease [Oscillospiraceae bacterium]|nr:CPBP family intramembrane metalloprotease [Oscillospiraceae bacterium]
MEDNYYDRGIYGEQPPPLPGPPPRVLETPTKVRTILGLVYLPAHYILSLIVMFVFMVVGAIMGMDIEAMTDPAELLGFEVVSSLVLTLVYVILAWRYLREDFGRLRKYGTKIIWVLLLVLVVATIIEFVLLFALGALGLESLGPNQEYLEDIARQSPWIIAFLAIVLAPIWEEILFRGMIFAPLRNRNRVVAYAVSTLGFALLHTFMSLLFDFAPTLFLVTLVYVPAGLALCWIHERTKSLWSAIFLHALMNVVAVGLMLVFP